MLAAVAGFDGVPSSAFAVHRPTGASVRLYIRPVTLPASDLSRAAGARVSRRLIPFLLLLYILNFLDRVNVGFAALEMNRDLDFGPEADRFAPGLLLSR